MTDLVVIAFLAGLQIILILIALFTKLGMLLVGSGILGVYNLARLWGSSQLTYPSGGIEIVLSQADLNVAVSGIAVLTIMSFGMVMVLKRMG